MPRSSHAPRRGRRRLAGLAGALALLVITLNWTAGRLPPEPRFTGASVRVNGLRVRYVERPGTGTPVVLLHGLPGTAEDFDAVTRRLGGRRTIALDRPGYGFSSEGYVPLERQLDAIAAVLVRLHVRRAVVVGHSYGGAIALGLGERHPERVAGLVLVAAAAGGFRQSRTERLRAHAVGLLGTPVVAAPANLAFSQLLRTVAARQGDRAAFAPSPVAGAHLRRLLALNMATSDVAALAGEQGSANSTVARVDAGLGRIRVPAVVVHGDQDRLVPIAHGRRLAEALQHARLVPVHGGHMTPYTHPKVIADAAARLGAPVRAASDRTR